MNQRPTPAQFTPAVKKCIPKPSKSKKINKKLHKNEYYKEGK